MNKTAMTCLTVVLAASSACAANMQQAREVFQSMDSNGDRKLQFTEIQAARARLFDRMDGNRNDVLDPGELQSAMEATKRQGDVQSFRIASPQLQARSIDTNADGKVTRNEFVAFIPDRLRQADANGDQVLELSELRTLGRR